MNRSIEEVRRQVHICNACRYCEGYCSVFPAMFRQRQFADGDLVQLANLCQNCRGCYYACQYSDPHEFNLNLPRALADLRTQSWEEYASPAPVARVFQRQGVALAFGLLLSIATMFLLAGSNSVGVPDAANSTNSQDFYTFISHNWLVCIFAPAFLLPLFSIGISLRRYWCEVGGTPVLFSHILSAGRSAASFRNLDGGQGQGCNYEDEDKFSNARRYLHLATLWGFLLCLASTTVATILHYVFDMPAPYGLLSLPKLLGLPGGSLLVVGTAGLAWLKIRADKELGTRHAWSGEMAFVLLLSFTGLSGLLLYVCRDTPILKTLLALHLGAVFTLFLLMPFSKMAHGFYRFTALVREAQLKKTR